MNKLFITSLLVFFALGAKAQQAAHADSIRQPHTLTWFLQQGLLNNYSIRIADNRQLTATENATRANAGMMPSVTASAGYGIDLASASSKARATDITTTNTNYLDHSVQAQVGLTWTAFDGFAMQARYAELKLLKQQGDLNRRMAGEELISSITAEYYNCIQQRIRLRNYRNAVRLSRERMRIVEARYNVGSFSRLDYMQAKVDFNADSAQYMKQQEALRTSVIELSRLVNLPSTADSAALPTIASYAALRIADTLIAVMPSLDYDELWQDVLAYNADLQQTALGTDLASQALRRVLARNYPYVRLNASYGYNYSGYGVATNRWASHWGPSAGVTMGIDLFDPTRRSARRAAQREVEAARLQAEDLQLSLSARFRMLRQSHINNLQILALEEQNLAAAQENYATARERYLLGDLSGIAMREAQQSLLNAEERILKAAYDTKMCEISLMLISGGIEKYLTTGR